MMEMRKMSAELDKLLEEEKSKNKQISSKQLKAKLKPCAHLPIITAREQELEKKDKEIATLKKQIEHYVSGKKDKELDSVKQKVEMAEKEKKTLMKKDV